MSPRLSPKHESVGIDTSRNARRQQYLPPPASRLRLPPPDHLTAALARVPGIAASGGAGALPAPVGQKAERPVMTVRTRQGPVLRDESGASLRRRFRGWGGYHAGHTHAAGAPRTP